MLTAEEIRSLLLPVAAATAPIKPDARVEHRELLDALPVEHTAVVQLFNGLTVSRGAYRLFGLRPEPYLDIVSWNESASWRFAWDDRLKPFLCFGETAWGDQYAYRRRPNGSFEPEIYLLEGTLLEAEILAPSFGRFLVDEFLRNARFPYDSITRAALARFGQVDPAHNWVFSPSLALGGEESVENVIELPAFTAMTFAGDIATSLLAAPPSSSSKSVETWTDDSGRARLRVRFV